MGLETQHTVDSTINPQTTDGQTVVTRRQRKLKRCTGNWSGARDMVSKNTYGMAQPSCCSSDWLAILLST